MANSSQKVDNPNQGLVLSKSGKAHFIEALSSKSPLSPFLLRVDRSWYSRNKLFLGVTLICAYLFSGCASVSKKPVTNPTIPEIDVMRMKENSDEAIRMGQVNREEIRKLQERVGALEEKVGRLTDQIGDVSQVKVEEIQNRLAILSEQFKKLEAMPRIAEQPPKPTEKPNPEPEPIKSTFMPSRVSIDSARAAQAKKNAVKMPPKAHSNEAEANLYKEAFELFQSRKYPGAIGKFQEIIKRFPSSPYLDNCHYWIGESHFAMGNFAKAVTSFRAVFTIPNTDKDDDSQLKLGYSYLRLGEKKRAVEEFKKLVSFYPDSEYAPRAKDELSKLE